MKKLPKALEKWMDTMLEKWGYSTFSQHLDCVFISISHYNKLHNTSYNELLAAIKYFEKKENDKEIK